MAAGFYRCFSEAEVEEVGNCRECRVVAAHQLGGGCFVGGFELDGADFFVASDSVHAGGDFFGALEIVVGERDGGDLRLPRHIERGGGTHHSRTYDQQLHAMTSVQLFFAC